MSKHQIAIYKAEREAGLAETIRANASVGYLVEVKPFGVSEGLQGDLQAAFAAAHQGESFDLYYMKDILASTGWNKNRDVFDRVEAWLARHTPEDKPFNFEHRPCDIIGHITASHVVDEDMREIPDDVAIDDLPARFHIVNGSVLYVHSSDPERQKLMEQTVAEIKQGEWYVSMECLFRGFDYGVIRPDGSHHVIPRNESTAFLTKHMAQYGGTGTYKCDETGDEFTIGRVLRNITFSGKGLVRKPANPDSIILSTAVAFIPAPTDSGYLTAGPVPSSNDRTETIDMPETNTNEQALRDQNGRLEKQIESLQAEVAGLKSKDTEAAIAGLREDVADRDKTIAGLQAQVDTVTRSVAEVQKRAEVAEAALAAAQEEVKVARAAETRRTRESLLREKHAPAEIVAGLVDQLAILDDATFLKTIETISASWKKPETKPKTDPVVAAVQSAKADEEPALTTASENQPEAAAAAVTDFMGKSLRSARGGRPSVFTHANADA